MEVGVVSSFNTVMQTGVIAATAGRSYSFRYGQGQSFMYGADLATPVLSGRHLQPAGSGLKLPRPGDAVICRVVDGHIEAWGYLRHYSDLVERRFGTEFATA